MIELQHYMRKLFYVKTADTLQHCTFSFGMVKT